MSDKQEASKQKAAEAAGAAVAAAPQRQAQGAPRAPRAPRAEALPAPAALQQRAQRAPTAQPDEDDIDEEAKIEVELAVELDLNFNDEFDDADDDSRVPVSDVRAAVGHVDGDGDGDDEEEDFDDDDEQDESEEEDEEAFRENRRYKDQFEDAEESSPGGGSVGVDEGVGAEKRRGRCKWFNVAKGWGFISPDDGGQDIFVHQSVVQMTGFRSLGDDEEVEFECKVSDKGLEATMVTGPDGADCQGSHRRPATKKRFRKIRCYNCGEFANHIAAKCTMGPQPKRCHHCKAEDHLIADCPTRKDKKDGKDDGGDSQGELSDDVKTEENGDKKDSEGKKGKMGKKSEDGNAVVPAAQQAAA